MAETTPSAARLVRIADLIQEAGMLRKTPRTGWAFFGAGCENVAEHTFRTCVLGYILAKLADVSPSHVLELCLFHDLHEARTGDFNYVYHRYNTTRARDALADGVEGTGFAAEILGFFDEFSAGESLEAQLANDADQLDLIANLAVQLAQGQSFARDWLDSALPRLRTEVARDVATYLLKTDPNAWWYGQVEKSFWIHHK